MDVPGLGSWTVFAQNLGVDAVARPGDQVLLRGTRATPSRSPGDEDLSAGVDPDVVEVSA